MSEPLIFLPEHECDCDFNPVRLARNDAIITTCVANDPRFLAVKVGKNEAIVMIRAKDGRVEHGGCWCFMHADAFDAAGGTRKGHGPGTFGHTDYFIPVKEGSA